jgi:hypothetical protein
MGHPALMKAIAASKKKNDKLDARKIADMVRCDLLPACYVAPVEIRELRRMLRYRNLVVGQATRMKNKMSGMLMEVGAEYNKERLHGKQYFTELLDTVEEVPDSVKDLLRLSRGAMETFETTQQQLLARLHKDPLLSRRVMLLESIRGVGEVTALTWKTGKQGQPELRSFSETPALAGALLRHMPRRSRCILPGLPCHVTQRGVNRCETFSSDQDRSAYLRLLRENLEGEETGQPELSDFSPRRKAPPGKKTGTA